jgi:hypothetical protein
MLQRKLRCGSVSGTVGSWTLATVRAREYAKIDHVGMLDTRRGGAGGLNRAGVPSAAQITWLQMSPSGVRLFLKRDAQGRKALAR